MLSLGGLAFPLSHGRAADLLWQVSSLTTLSALLLARLFNNSSVFPALQILVQLIADCTIGSVEQRGIGAIDVSLASVVPDNVSHGAELQVCYPLGETAGGFDNFLTDDGQG